MYKWAYLFTCVLVVASQMVCGAAFNSLSQALVRVHGAFSARHPRHDNPDALVQGVQIMHATR